MKKTLVTSFILLITASISMAQSAKVISAYNYLKSLDFESAKAAIDEATTDSKTGAQAKTWYYRGAIYEQLYIDTGLRKKYPMALPEAIKSFQKATEIDPKNQWKDEIRDGLLQCGSYSYNEGVAPYNSRDYQSAYDHFKAAADVYKYLNANFGTSLVDTFATLYAAGAAVKLKHYDDALALYTEMQNNNIQRPEIYSSMGDIYLAKGDTVKAQETISNGAQLFPNDNSLMIQQLNIAIAKAVQSVEPFNSISIGMTRDQVTKLVGKPKSVNTTKTAMGSEDFYFYDGAAIHFNKNGEVDYINLVAGSQSDGVTIVRPAEVDHAINLLDAAIKKKPEFTALYVQKGNLYDAIKDTTNARISYEQGIAKDPNSFDGYYRLGASYYNRAVDVNNQMNKLDMSAQKQYDAMKVNRDALFRKALPYLEHAHEIDAHDRDTMLALKELYARLNMMDKLSAIKKELDAQ